VDFPFAQLIEGLTEYRLKPVGWACGRKSPAVRGSLRWVGRTVWSAADAPVGLFDNGEFVRFEAFELSAFSQPQTGMVHGQFGGRYELRSQRRARPGGNPGDTHFSPQPGKSPSISAVRADVTYVTNLL
jgi:hypothetical protein